MALKDFRQDLAGIRQSLADARRRIDEAGRMQRALETERRSSSRLFREVVGDAVPLAPSNRASHRQAPVVPRPMPVTAVRAAAVASFSDGPDTIEAASEESDSFARDGIDQRTLRRLRRGELPVSGQLDLHGMTRDQARSATERFVVGASEQGLRCIRIIHGKGLGSADRAPVLKALVRRWLRQSAPVLAFTTAPAASGGSGALLILLASAATPPTARR